MYSVISESAPFTMTRMMIRAVVLGCLLLVYLWTVSAKPATVGMLEATLSFQVLSAQRNTSYSFLPSDDLLAFILFLFVVVVCLFFGKPLLELISFFCCLTPLSLI